MLKGWNIQQRFRPERIVAPQTQRDSIVERTDIDDDKTMVKLHKEHKKSAEKDCRDRRNPDHDLNRLLEKQKSARKVDNSGGVSVSGLYNDKESLKSELMLLLG